MALFDSRFWRLLLRGTPPPPPPPAMIEAPCPSCGRGDPIPVTMAGKIIKCVARPPAPCFGHPYNVPNLPRQDTTTDVQTPPRNWSVWVWRESSTSMACIVLVLALRCGFGTRPPVEGNEKPPVNPPAPGLVIPNPQPQAGPQLLHENPPIPARVVSQFDFIPSNAKGLFSVRVADLWKSEPIQQAYKKLPREAREHAELGVRLTGLDLADYERITAVVIGGLKRDTWVVIHTARPIDMAAREKIIAGSRQRGVTWEKLTHERHNDIAYDLANFPRDPEGDIQQMAVYVASDSVYVIGDKAGLHAAIDHFKSGSKGGDLARVRRLLETGTAHVTFGSTFDTDDEKALPKAPPALGMLVRLQGPKGLKASFLEATFNKLLEVNAVIEFSDAENAKTLGQQFDKVQGWAQFLTPIGDMLGVEHPLVLLVKEITKIQIEAKDLDVQLRAQIDLDKLLPPLAKTLKQTTDIVPQALKRFEFETGIENMTKLAAALDDYQKANKHYPQAVYLDANRNKPLYSWRVELLPYLGEEGKALYKRFDRTKAWNEGTNQLLLDRMPPVFAHPGRPKDELGHTCFKLPTGRQTIFHEDRKVKKTDLQDGRVYFLLVQHTKPVPWTAPQDLPLPDDVANVNAILAELGPLRSAGIAIALFDRTCQVLSRENMSAQLFLAGVDPKAGVDVQKPK